MVLDPSQFQGAPPKLLTVRTVSNALESCDSSSVAISTELAKELGKPILVKSPPSGATDKVR